MSLDPLAVFVRQSPLVAVFLHFAIMFDMPRMMFTWVPSMHSLLFRPPNLFQRPQAPSRQASHTPGDRICPRKGSNEGLGRPVSSLLHSPATDLFLAWLWPIFRPMFPCATCAFPSPPLVGFVPHFFPRLPLLPSDGTSQDSRHQTVRQRRGL